MKFATTVLALSLLSLNAVAGGNIANGEALVKKNNCASCHAKDNDYSKPIDASYPKLAGQHADYLAHALTAYKRGDGPNGRSNAIMGAQVKALSTKDIADIAAYLHSLPASVVTHR
jgi:cytochrome c553